MKLLKLSAVALFMAFAFTACKKDETTTPVIPEVPAIQGKWAGRYQLANNTEYDNLYFTVEDKGVFKLSDEENPKLVDATGTWELVGTQFKATIPNYDDDPTASFIFTAKFDSNKGELT
ncbi:MAG: hypothetical protein WBP45_04215 [Daejeonella sp.]